MALRLAELLGALSVATDLANGMAPEHGLRISLLATWLAAGDSRLAPREAYWAGLLRYLGCAGYAVEEARFAAGDDIGLRASFARHDIGRPAVFMQTVLRDVGRGAPPLARWRAVAGLLTSPGAPLAHAHAQCDAALHCGRKLGMGEAVLGALAAADERWDGSGLPRRLAGEALPTVQRVVEVARVAVAVHDRARAAGPATAAAAVCAELARRAGSHLDPTFVARLRDGAEALLAPLGEDSVWEAFLAAEPGLWLIGDEELDALCDAFALMADLKSGTFAGHSQGVAALAGAAGAACGLDEAAVRQLRRAALLHDLGRVAVPGGLWEKPGPLAMPEWERVRLHSYWTDRVLRRSPALAPLADIAGRAHERLDGSGYHRGEGAALAQPARLLAAADTYHACREPRAWRAAMPPDEARRTVLDEVRAGRLCARAVDAVLAAAGHAEAAGARAAPADEALSPREQEVLRLVVRGLTNKQIAKALAISPRTVQHHTIHIYAKAGVSSRAGVALWAVERGLFDAMGGR